MPTKKQETNSKYVELYKKYRPQSWDEVVGQDLVVQDLKRAVADDRLPTAYLFSGPRGTGKTTDALILAKAINCENPDGDGNPCNECATCISIEKGTCPGVHYISAANNGGVAEVRKFMDQARLASTVRKPVWIIDEVHRLSKEGFDALLIPLEDTTLPSLFIFCTTELSKVPTTITSRVQHRAFSLVSSEEITKLCERILTDEGYEKVDNTQARDVYTEDEGKPYSERRKVYTEETITKALRQAGVRVGGGSVRQVLSTLEKVLTNPLEAANNWNSKISVALFGKQDALLSLSYISAAMEDGEDPRDLTAELLDNTREMALLLRKDASEIDPAKIKRKKTALKLGVDNLLYVFRRIGEAQRDQLTGDDSRLYLELALIDIANQFNK